MLCLDNDGAGIDAVERLCSGNILHKVSEKYSIQFLVAKLPEGIKDPADFIEAHGGASATNSSVAFRNEVIAKASDWTEWFIHHLTSSLGEDVDDSTNDNFVHVCDRLATFLSSFQNAADRTRRAFEAAGMLSTFISKDSNTKSSALQFQLESDLLDMASRKAMAREALSRRIEKRDGVSAVMSGKISKLLNGESFTEESKKMSSQTNSPSKKKTLPQSTNRRNDSMMNEKNPYSETRPSERENWKNRYDNRNQKSQAPILPHFSGFHFSNPNDAEWLGVSGNNVSANLACDTILHCGHHMTDHFYLYVGSMYTTFAQKKNKDNLILGELRRQKSKKGSYFTWKSDDAIYFNSNEYLGGVQGDSKYRMTETMNGEISSSYNQMDKLIESANKAQIIISENHLLKTLVSFPHARTAMKLAIAKNVGTNSIDFEWSNKEREWLFKSMVDYPGFSPLPKQLQENSTIIELKEYLSGRPDVPPMAFGNHISEANINTPSHEDNQQHVEYNLNSKGILDDFFLKDHEDIAYRPSDPLERDTKIELTVQETLAVLLKANASKKLNTSKNHWKLSHLALSIKENKEELESATKNLRKRDRLIFAEYYNMDVEELSLCCKALGRDTNDAMKKVHELTESVKRIGKRMLDCRSSSRKSSKIREDWIKEMNEFVNNLPPDTHLPPSSGEDENYNFGDDVYDNNIDSRYGYKKPKTSPIEADTPNQVDESFFVNFINALPDDGSGMDIFLEDIIDGQAIEQGDEEQNSPGLPDNDLVQNSISHQNDIEDSKDQNNTSFDPSDFDNIFQ